MTLFEHRPLPCQSLYTSILGWLSIVVPAIFSTHAQASFQYTYFEAAYAFGELEFANSEVVVKGYELIAQFEVSPSIVLGVKYSSLDGDDAVIAADGVSTLVYEGSGPEAYTFFHSPLSAQTDFLLGAGIDMIEYEAFVQGGAPAVQKKDDTKSVFTGFRHKLNGLELQAIGSYNLDAEDNEDEWTYTLGLVSGEPTGLQLGFQITRKTEGDLMSVSVRQSY